VRKLDPATEVVHLGRDPAKHLGAVNTPVYRATTMVFPTLDDLEASAAGPLRRHRLRPARPADGHRPAGGDRALEGRHARLRGAERPHRDDVSR
jgi:cystathionine beta-lyase/cystathionine gamma-synthase